MKNFLDEMFRSLRHRNYRLFFAGQLISLVGTWMQNVAQSWLVWELTHSALWLGVIGFLTFFPMLLFSLIGGATADHLPKRALVIATQVVSMILAFALAAMVWTNTVTVWWVGAIAFLVGTVNAFDVPVRQAFIVDMVGRKDLTNAIGLNSAVFNSARLVGPALGGIVIGLVGTAWCFFLNGVSFIAVIIGLLAMNLPKETIKKARRSIVLGAKEALGFIRNDLVISSTMILVSVLTVFGWSYSVLTPLFADDVLHVGAVGLGNLYSANGIGALASALFVAGIGDRIRPRRLAFVGVVIFLVGVSVFALSHIVFVSMISMVLIGMGLILFFTTANSAIQRRTPDDLRGRVMGIYTLVFGGFYPFGSLEVGALAKVIGATNTILLNTALCAITAFFVWRRVARVRATDRPPVAPVLADVAERMG